MKIIYSDGERLWLEDEKRYFQFIDLAKVGYHLDKITDHYWVLCSYSKLCREDARLVIDASFHPNGKIGTLCFGYDINNIIRREILFDKNGKLRKDHIMVMNKQSRFYRMDFKTQIALNLSLEDYVSDEERHYNRCSDACSIFDKRWLKTNDLKLIIGRDKLLNKSVQRDIINDGILKEYMSYNKRYCNLLNHYSDNWDTLSSIAANFDDEQYLQALEQNIFQSKYSTNNKSRV